MIDTDPQTFRWILLLILVTNLSISIFHRRRARSAETIPRSAEPLSLRLIRALFGLPILSLMIIFMVQPSWAGSLSMTIPTWSRWLGALLSFAAAPLNLWVLSSLGKNVSETVLTKESHALVTTGPFRWVRHPLYTTGFLMIGGLSLLAASWPMAALTLIGIVFFSQVVIPREEAQLLRKFGHLYEAYKAETQPLIPGLWVL